MKTSSSLDGLTLRDSPGCFWVFGAFFCAAGLGAIVAAINSRGDHPSWEVALAILLGAVVFATGVYSIYDAPGCRIVVSKTRNQISISHRGLFRRQVLSLDLDDVRCAYLVEGKDIDDCPVFSIRIQLADGRELPLTRLWLPNRDNLERALALLVEYVPRGDTRAR